jgi:hypothetical protein
MYRLRVIRYGAETVLDRVQYVLYHLDPAYPKPIPFSNERKRNFELKELANGFSKMRAEVKIKNQEEPVELTRFINLSEVGPRLDVYMKKKDT